MLLVGIDDTDIIGSKGTNQLARAIVRALGERWNCVRIVRHQLLDDPRVPYTSQNGSASILFDPAEENAREELVATCRSVMRNWFIAGSDPGLCVTNHVPAAVIAFGRQAKASLVSQDEAYQIARSHGMTLEGLGGTNDGVIGALAAVGLAFTGDDGRIVQLGNNPDDLQGLQTIADLKRRNVTVHLQATGECLTSGRVDCGKKLRPNLRNHRAVLYVTRPADDGEVYPALKFP